MLTVLATGVASLAPDTIKLNLTLRSVREIYNEAIDDAATQLANLQRCLQTVGFVTTDLVTTNFYVNTKYEHVKDEIGNYKQVFMGYEVTQQLQVMMPLDMKHLSAVIAALSVCAAKPEFNLYFIRQDTQSLQTLALQDAAQKASQNAIVLAESLAVTITGTERIEVVQDYPVIQPRRYEVEALISDTSYVDITPEDIQTEVNISVTYRIN